ncbi:hypothetical protein EYC80_005993 [Monilinia laxa]|uniref:Uncharacterized protein n=1 Tax=Monilinia laxa TaxID=61186 RepID=A0A5N6KFU1_MONLA|nr:hypothetical protein EYC80_005993 [Monilinia laxa]
MYERVVRLAVYSILILCCTVSIYLHYTPYKLYNTYHNYYTILLIQTLSKMHDLFSFTSLQEFKAPQPPPSIHPFPHSSIPSFKYRHNLLLTRTSTNFGTFTLYSTQNFVTSS